MKKHCKAFKRLLACILTLSLAALIITGVTATADNTAAAWDGTVASEFAGGDGSKGSPYLISNAAQLARCVTLGKDKTDGKYFKLTQNIVVNADLKNNPIDWYAAAYNSPADDRVFNGTFDGDGYTVSGLYHGGDSGSYGAVGLFPAITEKTRIKNVGVVNSEINSGYYAGAIVGSLNAGWVGWSVNGYSDNYPSVVNCFVGDDVTVKADAAGGFIGVAVGLVPWNTYASIHNCAFYGKLEGTSFSGAEAGDYWDLWIFITNTFSTSPLNSAKIGGAKIGNVYTTEEPQTTADGVTQKVSSADARGENAKINMSGLDFDNVWMTNENAYPALRIFNRPVEYNVSFDLSAVEGAEVIADMTTTDGKLTLPVAPEDYHWLKGNEAVSGEITFSEDTVIKAEPHKGGTATCKDKAECEVCGESYGELSATHGDTELENQKDATCSEKGYTGDKVCKVCGAVLEEGKDIDKTAHSFEDGVCIICGETEENSGDPVVSDGDSGTGDSDSEISKTGESAVFTLVALIAVIYIAASVLLFFLNKRMKKA